MQINKGSQIFIMVIAIFASLMATNGDHRNAYKFTVTAITLFIQLTIMQYRSQCNQSLGYRLPCILSLLTSITSITLASRYGLADIGVITGVNLLLSIFIILGI